MATDGSRSTYMQYTDVTVTNTTTETTLIGTGNGTLTVPMGTYASGDTYRIRMEGEINTALVAPTLTLKIKLGGTTIMTSGAVSLLGSLSTKSFSFESLCMSTSDNSPADIHASTTFQTEGGVGAISDVFFSTTSVTTNQDNDFDITAQWSAASASNSITIHVILIELIET